MPDPQHRRYTSLSLLTLVCPVAVYLLGAPVSATSVCGSISGTLSAAGNPWTATCTITVDLGQTLTLDPGVELSFKTGATLKILGTFEAIGTPAQPISLRSNDGTPMPGYYATIEVSGSATIAHASLLHGKGWSITGELLLDQSVVADQTDAGGLAAISFADGSIGAVTNSSFDNPGRPIAIGLDTNVSFSNLQFATGHVARSILAAGGTWTSSHTWTDAGVPYEIDWFSFDSGTTQTFEPGVIFKFAGPGSLSFDNLQILGTSGAPVVFTSMEDVSWGGDTYGDGPGTPGPGDVGYIQVSGTALIQNAVLRFIEGVEITGHADVSGSSIDYSVHEALWFFPGSSGSVSSTTFDQNLRPLRLGTDADVSLSGLAISPAQTYRSILVDGGTWTHSRTWSDFGVPYELEGARFATGTTQTVEPGVVFKLRLGGYMSFDDIAINGTVDQPVVFTALTDDEYGGDTYGDGPQPTAAGDYSNFEFQGTATVDHAVFRFGSGLQVDGHADFDNVVVESQLLSFWTGAIEFDVLTTGSVRNSHFRDTDVPVSLLSNANPALSGLTSESQSYADAVLVSGTWSIDRTWSDPGLPYYVPSGLNLLGGSVQNSIAPGVVFKIATGSSLIIELETPVQGTSGQPVVFTSFMDDSVAGDTNVDGPSLGTAGDWGGLRIYAGGDWGHLDVRYAETGVVLYSGPTGSVRDSVFRFNDTGLRLESNDPIQSTVADSQFLSNGIGVFVQSPDYANLGILSDMDSTNDGRNHFACNVINVDTELAFATLVAEGNWWGATPPDASLFVGTIDADPYLTDWRSAALTVLRIDRSGMSDLALDWDDVAPACGYRVLRSSDAASGFVDASGPVSGANFIETGGLVSPGNAYYLVSIE